MESLNSIFSVTSIGTAILGNLLSFLSLEDIRMLPWYGLDLRTFFNISRFNQIPVLLSVLFFFYLIYQIYTIRLDHKKAGKTLKKVKPRISQKVLRILPIMVLGILIIYYLLATWNINSIFERVYDYNPSLAGWLALGELIGFIGVSILTIQAALYFALHLRRHLQIREKGIIYGGHGFIPWEQIASFKWSDMKKLELLTMAQSTKKSKFYAFSGRTSKDVISINLDAKREEVNSFKKAFEENARIGPIN